MKITAKAGGYSSVVGQSVLLQDETGRVVCQLALLNVGETLEQSHKELCNEYAMLVVDAINWFNAGKFRGGDRVYKTRGAQWQGRVCGFYKTELTEYGYAIESETHKGSVQIYPESALARVHEPAKN